MLSGAIQHLLEGYRASAIPRPKHEADILVHVDEIASKIAKFYEQIRKVVDYREEHLLRTSHIIRALRRHILLHRKDQNIREIAESLVKDIIRAGHLPNDSIGEAEVDRVAQIITNLLFLFDKVPTANAQEVLGMREWLIRIVASAVEETLDPPHKDRLMAEAMFMSLKDRLVIKGRQLSDNERFIQLYIAIERALLRVDEDQLSWRLSVFRYGEWLWGNELDLEAFAMRLGAMRSQIARDAAHPLGSAFFALCNRYNTVFLLLGDAVFDKRNFLEDPQELFRDEGTLETIIRQVYKKRFERQRQKMSRFAFFTIVSLFITKVLAALIIEIPIDVYLTHDFSFWHAAANIVFPPILMLMILVFIRMPTSANLGLVQEEVRAVVFEERRKEYLMVIPEKKSTVFQRVARLGYWIVSLVVLWGLWQVLLSLGFSVASLVVFGLFTSIVAATGLRAHNRSKEISLEAQKASFKSFLADLLFMPLVSLGQMVIRGMSRFRFLVVAVNLIEVPFQTMVGFVENFNAVVKSKKEELY